MASDLALLAGRPDENGHSDPNWLLLEGFVLLKARRLAEADNALRSYARMVSDDPQAFFYLACVHSMRGDTEKSLDFLEKAYRAGFRDLPSLRVEEMSGTLKDNRFYEISGRYFSMGDILAGDHSVRPGADTDESSRGKGNAE